MTSSLRKFPGLFWVIVFFFAFLYIPILILVALSLNQPGTDLTAFWWKGRRLCRLFFLETADERPFYLFRL